MKPCGTCERHNPDDALFCQQCGASFPAATSSLPSEEAELWRAFIGPSKTVLFSIKNGWRWAQAGDYYLEVFRKFAAGRTPRFALTWNWPAFLFFPFLWFLYRKMYLYAGVYLLGPALAVYMTGNHYAAIVWSIVAGATGNYIYYWHIKEQLAVIQKRPLMEQSARDRELQDLGGVQYYVLWLGVALQILAIVGFFFLLKEGDLENFKGPGKQPPAAPRRSV